MCCNPRRQRKTSSCSLSPPSICHYTIARFLKLGWLLWSRILTKLLLMVTIWQFMLGFSFSKCFKRKISGVAVLWVVKYIRVYLFGILPVSYLLAVECYIQVVFFHHLAQCLAHETPDEGVLKEDFLSLPHITMTSAVLCALQSHVAHILSQSLPGSFHTALCFL